MSRFCRLKQRVAVLQCLRPGVILRCRIESSWLADRQTGERPFSWMTHSVVLHYWDPETITRLSKCCRGHRSPEPCLGRACPPRGIVFMFYVTHNKTDRRDRKRERNICQSFCGGVPSGLITSSMTHWSLISGIYVSRRSDGRYDIGHSAPWKLQ